MGHQLTILKNKFAILINQNTFISERIKGEKFDDGIYFKIEKVRGKTDKENFDAKRTLEDGASNARSSEFFDDSKPEQNGAGTKRHGGTFEHLYRKHRGSARPKFLSERYNVVPKKKDETEKRLQ